MDGDAGFHKRVSLKSILQRTVVAWVRPWFLDNHYGALRAHELSIDALRTNPAGATALLAMQILPCTSLASGKSI